MTDKRKLQLAFRQYTHDHQGEWEETLRVQLGSADGITVKSSIKGMYYARTIDGQEILVHSNNTPPRFDLSCLIGKSRLSPEWQIIQVLETFDDPAAGNEVGYHAFQHQMGKGDPVFLQRKQILQLSILVSNPASWILQVYGAVVLMPTGWMKISNEIFDLSSYVITTGAKYLVMECDSVGVITFNVGTAFASILSATAANIPVPATGKTPLAIILMYGGQVLSNDDIIIPEVFFDTAGSYAPLTHNHAALYAPIAKGVTNGDTHDHVGGDGAVLSYTDVIGAFLNSVVVPASTTYHSCPFKIGADTSTTNFPWPDAGTLSDMTVRISTTQSATGSLVITLFVNGVATALTITIPAGSLANNYIDSTNTVALSANDNLRWVFVNNATVVSAALTGVSMKLKKSTT